MVHDCLCYWSKLLPEPSRQLNWLVLWPRCCLAGSVRDANVLLFALFHRRLHYQEPAGYCPCWSYWNGHWLCFQGCPFSWWCLPQASWPGDPTERAQPYILSHTSMVMYHGTENAVHVYQAQFKWKHFLFRDTAIKPGFQACRYWCAGSTGQDQWNRWNTA